MDTTTIAIIIGARNEGVAAFAAGDDGMAFVSSNDAAFTRDPAFYLADGLHLLRCCARATGGSGACCGRRSRGCSRQARPRTTAATKVERLLSQK